MAPSYRATAASHTADPPLTDARDGCWQAAFAPGATGPKSSGTDSNFGVTLSFAADDCQLGGRTLAGSPALGRWAAQAGR